MRRPALNDWDRALLAIWGLIAMPIFVLGWLDGFLLPPIWSSDPLLINRMFEAALLLLVYGLPVVVLARLAFRALR